MMNSNIVSLLQNYRYPRVEREAMNDEKRGHRRGSDKTNLGQEDRTAGRQTSIYEWICLRAMPICFPGFGCALTRRHCKERGHRRVSDKDILGQVDGTAGRQRPGKTGLSRGEARLARRYCEIGIHSLSFRGFQTLSNPSPVKSLTFAVAKSFTPCASRVRADRTS